jgi:hypothetical protein
MSIVTGALHVAQACAQPPGTRSPPTPTPQPARLQRAHARRTLSLTVVRRAASLRPGHDRSTWRSSSSGRRTHRHRQARRRPNPRPNPRPISRPIPRAAFPCRASPSHAALTLLQRVLQRCRCARAAPRALRLRVLPRISRRVHCAVVHACAAARLRRCTLAPLHDRYTCWRAAPHHNRFVSREVHVASRRERAEVLSRFYHSSRRDDIIWFAFNALIHR